MPALLVIPTPPRLSGLETNEQISAINTYCENVNRILVTIGGVFTALSEIVPVELGITDPPTQAEVEAVRDKLNEVIAAAGALSLESGDS
jgi:hypothetical protein